MRKICSLLIALALVLAIGGCTGTQIALVNPGRLFQDSESGKAGIRHLKELEATMQQQFTSAQKMIEKKPGDEALRVKIQREFSAYQQIVNSEQQKVVESINNQIKASLETVRTQKKLDVIFSTENALDFNGKMDVTDAVLSEMNRSPLTFAPTTITPIEDALKKNAAQPAPARNTPQK